MSVPPSAPSLQVDEAVDPFMLGLTFHYVDDEDAYTVDKTAIDELIKAVRRFGGRVEREYDPASVTHVVLKSASEDEHLHQRATLDHKRVVTWNWLEACVRARALVPVDDSVLFAPPPTLDGHPDMRDVRVCVTGYTGERRNELIDIVGRLGAEYMRVLDRKSTHLVCYEFEGAKWAKANQTGLQRIVSHRWLEACLRKWEKVPEAPYSSRSGREEDELAAAAADDPEIPDSQDPEGGGAPPDSEEARARAGATERKNASLGTFVTELTAGMIPGGEAATVLRERVGAETQEATDALTGLGAKGGGGTMEPPAPRAPRGASQSQPTPTGKVAAPPPACGPMLQSPDWDALEARPSQHIERSKRDRTMDPAMREALEGLDDGEARARLREMPDEVRNFAGRIGDANDVEAAFGGRFVDRQPERWHRFNDADAPLAADDFDAFLADIGAGTWDPDPAVDESGAWARRLLAGKTLFEILAVRPKRVPEGVNVAKLPRLPGYLASLDRGDDEDADADVELWIKLHAESERKKNVGPLGAAVIARLRLETAKQPEARGRSNDDPPLRAGPDALLATFLEVYCPFGLSMQFKNLRAMLRERSSDGTRLELRDPSVDVILPTRYPGNLDGIYLQEVRRPLSEVVVGFHELLAGPTEPDLTQAPSPRDPVVAPPSTKAWTVDDGARISVRACAPGSQAAQHAASAYKLAGASPIQDDDELEHPTATKTSMERTKTTSAAAEPPADEEEEEIHRDLAAQLDECITQRQTEEEEEDEEDVIVAAGARRGRKKQAVLLTQDTGEDAGEEMDAGEDERAPEKTGDDAPARRGRAAKKPPPPAAAAPAAKAKTPASKVGKPASKEKTPASKAKAKTPASKEKTPASKAKAKTPASKEKPTKKPAATDPPAAPDADSPPPPPRRPRIALSGFGSADLTKYGATVARLGASVCAGHAWDAGATHVVFGPRGSRSLKFLAAAAAGVPLLDASFLDASRRAKKLLGPEAHAEHLWKGGWRGADMGLVSPTAAAKWHAAEVRPFASLTVAVAPFPSVNRVERDMLITVLKAGGARVATISAKGELIPDGSEPDVAVIDPSSMATAAEGGESIAAGRAAAAVAAVAGGACVSPEFFKSWLSRPESDLEQHVLRGKVMGELADALAARGAPAAAPKETGAKKTKTKGAATAHPATEAGENARATRAAKMPAGKASAEKAPARSKRSPPADRPAPIVGKRRRVLAARN